MATESGEQTLFDPVAFGSQIARRRDEMGLTQEALAEAMGISRVQVQNIESGWSDRAKGTPSNPRLSTLIGLCRELGGRIDLAHTTGLVIIFDPLGAS